ncbi:hypothetical protein F5890DRAFT_1555044 [Lentinula detonsa]|uniref:Uncharacterized protein n=1 Tax=Lentinula detonsa TaxID=2804962 RepID=A0AA38UR26_9AGAR|nr:hypothetical protein F5890DRAFT_1555044 [Lentinula detonsa]
MAEPSLHGSRHRSQPSVSRTNTSIRSASTQQGHAGATQSPRQTLSMPMPSPTSGSNPRRPERRGVRSYFPTNPDPETEDSADEYVDVTAAEAIESQVMGFDVQPVAVEPTPRRKEGGKRFIGGFVRSLRKIPRTMFKHEPHVINTDAPLRQPTASVAVPSYMLTPPTPALPTQATSTYFGFGEPRVPETPDILSTTSPHPTRIELDDATIQSPEHNFDRDPNIPPMSRHTSHHTSHHTSQHASQHNNNPSTNRNSYAYPNSYHNHNPPSIAAHPQPSPDYRRMSRHTGEESVLAGYSSGTPSFSTELDRNPFRVLKALVNMPWISHERVTVDYSPGMEDSRGALRVSSPDSKGKGSKDRQSARWSIVEQGWKPWKRTSVFLTQDGRIVSAEQGPSALARGDARKGKMYVPVNKPQTSWYSGGHITKSSRHKRSRRLDLMSSGSEPGGRSSVGSTPRVSGVSARRRVSRSTLTSPSSPNSPPPTRRPRNRETSRNTPRRQSRTLYYSNNEYAFLDPGSTPGSSPILARRSNMKSPPRGVHRDRISGNIRRRYSREISRHPAQPLVPPMPPPASPYPLSPLVFVQSTHLESPAGGADPRSHPQTGPGMPVPVYGVTPMYQYMSILPGMPPPPAASGGGVGESSPPGFAGRGAGGGYEPGYGVQGYAGTGAAPPGGGYTYGYAYPYPQSQSPPLQVQPHDSDTRKSPPQTTG